MNTLNTSSFLLHLFENKSVCILGYGMEGKSTYKFIRNYLPEIKLTIIDKSNILDKDNILKNDCNLEIIYGDLYLNSLKDFDVIIKSPGVPSNSLPNALDRTKITSHTDIFLKMYRNQVIGVTGTKGKSTTSSLIYHILKNAGKKTLLVGNIGLPPLDCISLIDTETTIVMEMSSHQLEFVSASPHTSILLNLYPEHLDHYNSYSDYITAKFNIGKHQNEQDIFFVNIDNSDIADYLHEHKMLTTNVVPFSLLNNPLAVLNRIQNHIEFRYQNNYIKVYDTLQPRQLIGDHNLYNISVAAAACFLRNVPVDIIGEGIASFHGLEHRIESVGEYKGIHWYNDSIATIPEATIAAVQSLKTVNTLILGGFDKRKIDFSKLYAFLPQSNVENIVFTGEAGERMMNEFRELNASGIQLLYASDYRQVVQLAAQYTKKGTICLLSPAASSYDKFKNFEERGKVFKQYIKELKK